MKIKFYILLIYLHLLVLSGCGISKDESSLIIDAPVNSKIERTIKNFIPHYEITFPEEDNHPSIIKIPIKPSDEFISTFLDTFAKNFKDELIKQLEPTGIELKEIRSNNINFRGPIYDTKGIAFTMTYLSSKEKNLEAIYIINEKKHMWQVSFTGDEAHLKKTNELLKKLKNSNSKK